MRTIISLLLIFYLAELINAENSFIINSFSVRTSSSQRATDICISPDFSDTLIPCTTPLRVKMGELIMRRKINETGYCLYKGRLDTAAFTRKPSRYSFPVPKGVRLDEMIKYRLYHTTEGKAGNDEGTVYFDNARIYLQHFNHLYYFKNSTWFDISGDSIRPIGSLSISSIPSGARVFLNGIEQPAVTPCTVARLTAGPYIVELSLPHFHFTAQPVEVVAGRATESSFELLSDIDTAYITGKVSYGLLMLPHPPTDTLYRIDNDTTGSCEQRLPPGKHRICWNGGLLYTSLDTTISIEARKIQYLDIVFKRCYGTLKISVEPRDANVKIEGVSSFSGDNVLKIPSDVYHVTANRYGYEEAAGNVRVVSDSTVSFLIKLHARPDRDRDGFPDSIDNCPDDYGFYDGCPKRRIIDAMKVKLDELAEYSRNDSFEIGFNVIGFIARTPVRRHFADFLSDFSIGNNSGLNNYRGLTFANSFHVMFRGLYASLALGQWSSGLVYRRDDTLRLSTPDGTGHYMFYYDSLSGVEPVAYIPSTAAAFGLHFTWPWLNVVYAIGYQWEDIVFRDCINLDNNTRTVAVFNNDFWFHQLSFEADLKADKRSVPGIYCCFKLPFSKAKRTSWLAIEAGMGLKFYSTHREDKKS
jgi:hypothetical protein